MNKLFVFIVVLILQSCLVKEVEWGGKSRIQLQNQSDRIYCSFYFLADESPHWALDSLKNSAKSKPVETDLWGKFDLVLRNCSGVNDTIPHLELHGASVLWTVSLQGDKLIHSESVISEFWF